LSAQLTKAELKKAREAIHVEELAKLIKADWRIEPSADERATPDFIISDARGSFGLEHTQAFRDTPDRDAGSPLKSAEAKRHARVAAIAKTLETEVGFSIKLMISSDRLCEDGESFALDKLSNQQINATILSTNLQQQQIGDALVTSSFEGIKIFARRCFRSQVELIQDRVGWVGWAEGAVQAAIDSKSGKLAKYRAAGVKDIRLLVVCDRLYNSGKLSLTPNVTFDRRGFDRVYFLSYPGEALEF